MKQAIISSRLSRFGLLCAAAALTGCVAASQGFQGDREDFGRAMSLREPTTTEAISAEATLFGEAMRRSAQRAEERRHREEEERTARNQANANFLRDVFGDPDKKKRRKTNCLVIRKLELEPVYGIYGTGGAGGAGGAGGGNPNC